MVRWIEVRRSALRAGLLGLGVLTALVGLPLQTRADDDAARPPATQDAGKSPSDDHKAGDRRASEPKTTADPNKPKVVIHDFTGTFNGEHVSYQAIAGETILKNDKGEPTASLFTVAYIRKDAKDQTRRPVVFVFNGGPGSSSLWLHMGAFGPKRVLLRDDASNTGAAPYRIEDNPASILDTADLVFIDPVGTGYSHAVGSAKDEDFWGLNADAGSIANFIRVWLTQNQRWNSPKYLAGESYGTTRAAALMEKLQPGYDGVYFNGIIMMSAILDFHTVNFQSGNDLPYVSYLPTYAAAAWYHGKLNPKPDNLPRFLEEVRNFAGGEYTVALLKGSRLPADERAAVIKRLTAYTGLSEDYLDQTDLRIDASRFRKELLRREKRVIGRYDARAIGEDGDTAGAEPENDSALYNVDGAFVAAVNDYLTRVLKVAADRRYKILDGEPGNNWKWAEGKGWPTYVNVAPTLGQAMRENKDLRLFVANGYYDLATPFFATEMTLAHNGIKADRVTLDYFDAGHMLYTHGPSRERLAQAIRRFIKAGGGPPTVRDTHD